MYTYYLKSITNVIEVFTFGKHSSFYISFRLKKILLASQ
jgi:hypothetical protein